MAFNYSTTLCSNRNFNTRFVLLPWQGYKLVITQLTSSGFELAKYHYSASASPRPRIVFCMQPSEMGYNYYLYCVLVVVLLLCGGGCVCVWW